MKKSLSRALALVGLLALSIALPGCSSYDAYPVDSYGYTSVGVTVYGTGYYSPGWGGCCFGGVGGVPGAMPIGYR